MNYPEKSFEVNAYNSALEKTFFRAGGIGLFGAITAEMCKFGLMYGLFEKGNAFMETFIFNGKGAFQALLYGQIINGVITQAKSNKGFKARNLNQALQKDHSITAAGLTMLSGGLWEAFSMATKHGKFDTTDMAFYGVGVAAMVLHNKVSEAKLKSVKPTKDQSQTVML